MLSGRFAQWAEWVALALIVVGIASLCQPWVFWLYRYGFSALLAGVVSFIVFSHRRPVR